MDKWPAYARLSTVAPAGHLPTASQHPQTPSRGALSSPRGVAIAREMGGAVASDLTTGMEAKTIHRLLETDPRTGEFRRTEEHSLECDLLVVDEASMVDVLLMRSL